MKMLDELRLKKRIKEAVNKIDEMLEQAKKEEDLKKKVDIVIQIIDEVVSILK
jgi:hypothetical protein